MATAPQRPWGTSVPGSQGDSTKDVQMASPPLDSVSDLSWSPVSNHLVVASWDGLVRIYDMTTRLEGTILPTAGIEFGAPALSCNWSSDGTKVVGGGADNAARLTDLNAGIPARQIGIHDAPIRCVRFFQEPHTNAEMVVTGSWDRTVKYWDLRTDVPVGTMIFPGKIYALDVKNNLMVVAVSDGNLNIVDLKEKNKVWKTRSGPLKHQIRAVSCFTDGTGFAVASIEGRCAFQWVVDDAKSYSFKCHREPIQGTTTTNVYTINSISTHPKYGTFATGGSDGSFQFWDKDRKCRLKEYSKVGGPITATAFNGDGTLFAYSVTYDWSMGYAFNGPEKVGGVRVHRVVDEEIKPRGGRV